MVLTATAAWNSGSRPESSSNSKMTNSRMLPKFLTSKQCNEYGRKSATVEMAEAMNFNHGKGPQPRRTVGPEELESKSGRKKVLGLEPSSKKLRV
jgi:hypothetical protein